MSTLTLEDRDRLRALAENATPGPWIPHPSYVWTSELGGIIQNWSEDANAAADMELIAASRQAVPALLDMLDQAEARIRDLTQEARDERAACLDQIEQVQARDARIKAVRDVLGTWATYCQTEQTARALSSIYRALDGDQ